MNKSNFKKSATRLKQFGTGFLLVAFSLQIFPSAASAQFTNDRRTGKKADERLFDEAIGGKVRNKIAPDLEEQTDRVFYNMRGDETQKVIIQLKSETHAQRNIRQFVK